MASNISLEVKVIKRFVNKSKRDRYIQFVSSEKNRVKFIKDLSHFNFLEPSLFAPVNGIEEDVILTSTEKNGVANTTCYVISENKKIDAKFLNTKEAISATVGHGLGTMLVFGDAEMIFYECETMNIRYISKKVTQ
ncbi:hypothetical protein [Hymenobacter elongatus]|uniref:Uncharacterized protein n=1 Tax=Hymenobacter elongatus TaxID=877208 RepID=A0A4Z0PHI2_9BACT|nr:hypothetical protein [Hymenobacter elongatus]TGE14208.1 hypothetical protein E5J99_16965 [Hymenobacter elongatus]